ncbi:MAG: amino acid ABC transporter permease [bacterium]|nr:amino acid ABC transporter permease [bacterium]
MFLLEYYNSIAGYLPGFLTAAVIVVQLTVAIIAASLVIGFIAAWGKSSKHKIIRLPFVFYIWFIRGTPALTQILLVYYGLPQLNINFSPFLAGVLALSVNSGAYIAEIVRAGFLGIPKGQTESAIALGMSRFLAFRRILFPQLLKIILPPITNMTTSILKNTSLLSTITIVELTFHAKVVVASTFRPFDFYIIAAFIYLFMTSFLTRLSKLLEQKLAIAYQ